WDFGDKATWSTEWLGNLPIAKQERNQSMSLVKAWVPYILLGVILIITRLDILPLKAWLNSFKVGWSSIFGTTISAVFEPLYLPGTVFLIVVIIAFFFHKMTPKAFGQALSSSGKTLIGTAITLFTAVPMVRIFINSGFNEAG